MLPPLTPEAITAGRQWAAAAEDVNNFGLSISSIMASSVTAIPQATLEAARNLTPEDRQQANQLLSELIQANLAGALQDSFTRTAQTPPRSLAEIDAELAPALVTPPVTTTAPAWPSVAWPSPEFTLSVEELRRFEGNLNRDTRELPTQHHFTEDERTQMCGPQAESEYLIAELHAQGLREIQANPESITVTLHNTMTHGMRQSSVEMNHDFLMALLKILEYLGVAVSRHAYPGRSDPFSQTISQETHLTLPRALLSPTLRSERMYAYREGRYGGRQRQTPTPIVPVPQRPATPAPEPEPPKPTTQPLTGRRPRTR